jgi:hypothetical protein
MDQETARQEAKSTYNRCFDLLDLTERTVEQDAEMLATAWTSRHRWLIAGGTREWMIADWMVSRVAAALASTSPGFAQLSLEMATHALEMATPETVDWMRASLAEGMARAAIAVGDAELTQHWMTQAELLVAQIEHEDERAIIESQLNELR